MSADVLMLHGGEKMGTPAEPDQHVVAELEYLLEAAKSGRIAGISYAIDFADNSTNNRYVGIIGRGTVGALFAMMRRISAEIDA